MPPKRDTLLLKSLRPLNLSGSQLHVDLEVAEKLSCRGVLSGQIYSSIIILSTSSGVFFSSAFKHLSVPLFQVFRLFKGTSKVPPNASTVFRLPSAAEGTASRRASSSPPSPQR